MRGDYHLFGQKMDRIEVHGDKISETQARKNISSTTMENIGTSKRKTYNASFLKDWSLSIMLFRTNDVSSRVYVSECARGT